jgi:hypothetical protein
MGLGLCEVCGREIEKLWEGGYKMTENREAYLGHHLCPETKAAIWEMIEKRRATEEHCQCYAPRAATGDPGTCFKCLKPMRDPAPPERPKVRRHVPCCEECGEECIECSESLCEFCEQNDWTALWCALGASPMRRVL